MRHFVNHGLALGVILLSSAATAAPAATGNSVPAPWYAPVVQTTSGTGWNPWPIDGSGYPIVSCIGCSGGGGGGGGGGAVTGATAAFADGWDLTAGTKADAAWGGSGGGSQIAILKAIYAGIAGPLPAGANALGSVTVSNLPGTQTTADTILDATVSSGKVQVGLTSSNSVGTTGTTALTVQGAASGVAIPVSGTFWQATQPVSGTLGVSSLPALPAGGNAIGSVSVSNLPSTQAVSGTFWQATQPVSAASLPLPAGAATSANQVVPTAAGTSGANAASIQGIAGGVAVPVSGTFWQTTQPVSITSNVPTYLQAVSSGGASTLSTLNTAASTMATSVKASAGMIYGYEACNNTAAVAFFRLFNIAVAPTVGTSTPLSRQVLAAGQCARFSTDIGLAYGTGISFDVTTGSMTDADTTAITTAGTVSVQIIYK